MLPVRVAALGRFRFSPVRKTVKRITLNITTLHRLRVCAIDRMYPFVHLGPARGRLAALVGLTALAFASTAARSRRTKAGARRARRQRHRAGEPPGPRRRVSGSASTLGRRDLDASGPGRRRRPPALPGLYVLTGRRGLPLQHLAARRRPDALASDGAARGTGCRRRQPYAGRRLLQRAHRADGPPGGRGTGWFFRAADARRVLNQVTPSPSDAAVVAAARSADTRRPVGRRRALERPPAGPSLSLVRIAHPQATLPARCPNVTDLWAKLRRPRAPPAHAARRRPPRGLRHHVPRAHARPVRRRPDAELRAQTTRCSSSARASGSPPDYGVSRDVRLRTIVYGYLTHRDWRQLFDQAARPASTTSARSARARRRDLFFRRTFRSNDRLYHVAGWSRGSTSARTGPVRHAIEIGARPL